MELLWCKLNTDMLLSLNDLFKEKTSSYYYNTLYSLYLHSQCLNNFHNIHFIGYFKNPNLSSFIVFVYSLINIIFNWHIAILNGIDLNMVSHGDIMFTWLQYFRVLKLTGWYRNLRVSCFVSHVHSTGITLQTQNSQYYKLKNLQTGKNCNNLLKHKN